MSESEKIKNLEEQIKKLKMSKWQIIIAYVFVGIAFVVLNISLGCSLYYIQQHSADGAKADYYFITAAYVVTVFVIADLLLVLVPFLCVYHKQDD